MATDRPVRVEAVPRKRLWFGMTTAAVAWLTAGFIDLLIVWHVCGYSAAYGMNRAHWDGRVLAFAITVMLFLIALAAGITSYRNWRTLSHHEHLLDSSATDPREFVALVGVIISVTLGVGIVWLLIPPLLIQLCVRAK